jgi:D-alanine-D-alanine ligase
MGSLDIATPAFRFLKNGKEAGNRVLETIEDQFSLPLIVKPNAGGSTVGLTVVSEWSQLQTAIDTAARERAGILIEDYIKGRELTVAVVDGDPLPVVEIKPKSGLYDFEAKYTKGKTEYIAPAEIPEQLALRIQADAVRFFDALGASGLARVDFMLNEEGEHFCLELNTLPGMTELSLSPMAAKAAGQSFEELLDRIITSALKHHQA